MAIVKQSAQVIQTLIGTFYGRQQFIASAIVNMDITLDDQADDMKLRYFQWSKNNITTI